VGPSQLAAKDPENGTSLDQHHREDHEATAPEQELESATWVVAYLLLGALSDQRTAMLYSLGAMTTYGHSNVHLKPHWELLGAMEALQGMLLFGLTTAFLFSIFREVSPVKTSQVAKWAADGEVRRKAPAG
jgi:hypothetical protein